MAAPPMASVEVGGDLVHLEVDRQAKRRPELLSAVTRHVDEVKDIDSRLAASRAAPTGRARLDAFVQAWGDYIPEIQGMARALMAMRDTDAEARAAWDDRMAAVREGCAAAARALEQDGDLRADLDVTTATDLLTALLSVETWRQLREGCGWEQDAYVRCMQRLAAQALMG